MTLSFNPYTLFLEKFPDSDFLTFNYDGLIEILLLHRQRWTPADGFGVPVQPRSNAAARWIQSKFCTTSPGRFLHDVTRCVGAASGLTRARMPSIMRQSTAVLPKQGRIEATYGRA